MNIIISIIAVKLWGLIGIAVGSFVALLYQIIWMICYNSKNIIQWPVEKAIKQIVIDLFVVVFSYFATRWLILDTLSYISWFILALKTFAIVVIVWFVINLMFYRENLYFVKCQILKRGRA